MCLCYNQLMDVFEIREIISDNISNELQKIGFDDGYRFIAAKKFRYKNLKIYNLNPAQANIIKQTALTVGADCATHRDVITGNIEFSNVILGGSDSQLEKVSEKLKCQPFNLKKLGEIIDEFLSKKRHSTKLAGILNITQDSFSDGGKYFAPYKAKRHLMQLISDGADMIDIGAESTRPYSDPITPDIQIKRLRPILEFIQNENINIPISVDTRSSEVAEFALDMGANIINDVSGFDYDPNLVNIVAKYHAGIIIQHSQGNPQNMQNMPMYNDVMEEIWQSLKSKAEHAQSLGINNIILDPGIGFGKTTENNFEILNRIEEFYSLNLPIMVGVSRKSLLGVKGNDNDLKDTLSAAISYPLIQKKVDYLRVHNVKLHKQLLKLA